MPVPAESIQGLSEAYRNALIRYSGRRSDAILRLLAQEGASVATDALDHDVSALISVFCAYILLPQPIERSNALMVAEYNQQFHYPLFAVHTPLLSISAADRALEDDSDLSIDMVGYLAC